MYPATLMRNGLNTAKVLTGDMTDCIRRNLRTRRLQLDEREQNAMRELDKNGFTIIEGFYSRDRALALRDELLAVVDGKENCDMPSGAKLRRMPKRNYDSDVMRLFHVDCVSDELRNLRYDPFVFRVAEAYYGIPFFSGMFMFQYNPASNAVTRGYHVDSFAKEYKSFLYLDDTDERNGPFTYIRGSHQFHGLRIKRQFWGNGADHPMSFSEQELGDLIKEEVKITGQAGTLILADTRGLHRGSPQLDRSRAILVNYLIKHKRELQAH